MKFPDTGFLSAAGGGFADRMIVHGSSDGPAASITPLDAAEIEFFGACGARTRPAGIGGEDGKKLLGIARSAGGGGYGVGFKRYRGNVGQRGVRGRWQVGAYPEDEEERTC